VQVKAGTFLLGSDKGHDPEAFDEETPQHEVHLPDYFIGRYPVTVAQFRAFIEDSGYRPEDEDYLQGVPNPPVVSVTWYEALKYCRWLTGRLRGSQDTPEPLASLLGREGWEVGLPSEAEWEKAARGSEGWIYPCGDMPDAAQANYADTGINRTSTVGCFPTGGSPAGCLDVAGDVLQWTRSLWGGNFSEPRFKYPYTPDDNREDLAAPETIFRVLRGGAFNFGHGLARCAYRSGDSPDDSLRLIGFRVVVRPCRWASGLYPATLWGSPEGISPLVVFRSTERV
jgi:formylglycine-generating enzyme required for sulfatase activity